MATVIKLKRSTTASAVPTTSDLVDGELAVNVADQKIYIRNGASIVELANTSGTDLGSVGEDILPSTTETYNLGSSSKRWNELFLAGTTINLGGSTITSADGSGTIDISSSGATLPAESKVSVGSSTSQKIALEGNDGTVIRSVPFFSAADGLSTPNARLNFRARSAGNTVASFTLANGSSVSATAEELFLF